MPRPTRILFSLCYVFFPTTRTCILARFPVLFLATTASCVTHRRSKPNAAHVLAMCRSALLLPAFFAAPRPAAAPGPHAPPDQSAARCRHPPVGRSGRARARPPRAAAGRPCGQRSRGRAGVRREHGWQSGSMGCWWARAQVIGVGWQRLMEAAAQQSTPRTSASAAPRAPQLTPARAAVGPSGLAGAAR